MIEAIESITIRLGGKALSLEPGQTLDLPSDKVMRLLELVPGMVRVYLPTIQPGDQIQWERADLTIQHGVVDFLQHDADGSTWAFVTIGESWAAINMKFVKGSGHE